MNRHYTETRIVARLVGQINAAVEYGNDDDTAALRETLADTIDKLVARGIPLESIDQAITRPIRPT